MTRPIGSGRRLLGELQAAMADTIPVIEAPVLEIEPIRDWPVLPDEADLIVTSAHAVRGSLDGRRVYCVGRRTSDAALREGARIVAEAPDAESLIRVLSSADRSVPLIHLCGSHKAVDITGELTRIGFECKDLPVYAQRAVTLSSDAKRVLEGEEGAVLPLFSPRTARLVGSAVDHLHPDVHVISISDAVARSWAEATGGESEVAPEPTGAAMMSRIVAALRR